MVSVSLIRWLRGSPWFVLHQTNPPRRSWRRIVCLVDRIMEPRRFSASATSLVDAARKVLQTGLEDAALGLGLASRAASAGGARPPHRTGAAPVRPAFRPSPGEQGFALGEPLLQRFRRGRRSSRAARRGPIPLRARTSRRALQLADSRRAASSRAPGSTLRTAAPRPHVALAGPVDNRVRLVELAPLDVLEARSDPLSGLVLLALDLLVQLPLAAAKSLGHLVQGAAPLRLVLLDLALGGREG